MNPHGHRFVATVATVAWVCGGCITLETPSSSYLGQHAAQGTTVYVTSDGRAYATSSTLESTRISGSRSNGNSTAPGSGATSGDAGAGSSSTEARQPVETLLIEIKAAYRKGASSTVLETARTVLTYTSATARQKAEASMYAGGILYALGDRTGAYGYFRAAVKEDPDAIPPDDIRTSGLLDVFMRARRDETGP